ncbi:MAG: nicotinamide-nucleotide amidohydrolase family protein [Clostridia bacterium]|nr:nicotinamide-nucleotide amidohydrolase family protein [Clostridia bacterium]
MKAEIITIGANSEQTLRFLTQELAVYGIDVATELHIDRPEGLGGALREALRRHDRVVICGGLEEGSAARVAEELGLPLCPEETSLRRLQEYTAANEGATLAEELCWIPRGATPFLNEHGALPGWAVEKYGQLILLLPGAPGELTSLFQQKVAPFLAAKCGDTLFSRTVGVFGLSEGAVTGRLSDLLAAANPALSLFPRTGGEILLRVTARAENREAAKALCQPVIADIEERLGAFVYGLDVGSLQQAVVRLLNEKQMKIATAESCTAGLLSGKLTGVSGASAVFECGVAAYSKEIKHEVLGVSEEILKTQGAVCADTAAGMATGARRVGGSHIGVGITGEAGPTSSEGKPVGTVFIALADNRRVWVKELHATGADRDTVREIATCQTLDLVRRYLEALPAVMAGGQLLEEALPAPVEIPKAAPTKKRRILSSIFPWKGDRPAAFWGKLFLWLGVLAMLVVTWLLVRAYIIVPAQNREQYASLEFLYTGDTSGYSPEDFPEGMLAQFYALYKQNPDIKGWIRIPDTNISYPVMQNSERDYATLNFSGESSPYGVPYFDNNVALATPQSVNRSYVIHGNNTGDGQMFSDLTSYTDANFLLRHPTVEMNTVFATGTYQVFAVLYVDERDTDFDYRTASFDSDEDFLAFTAALQERSLFVTSVTPQKEDTLLLLETDAAKLTGVKGIRLAVAARLRPPGALIPGNLDISYNPDPLLPGAMQEGSTTRRPTVGTATTTVYQSSDEIPDIEMPPVDLPTTETPTTTGETVTTTDTTDTTAESLATTVTTTERADTTTVGTTTTTTEPAQTAVTTTTTGSTTTAPTTTTTTEITTPTTTASGAVDTPQNWPLESAFYSTLKVKYGADSPTPIRSKEDLQYAVACVVKTEMGSARSMQNSTEAQKAQAVASYTYMLYTCRSGGTFSISSRIDLNNANDRKIYNAVGEVLGVKLADTAQTKLSAIPLCAMYSSSSNGGTSSCQNVYTAALPYLQSVESKYDTEEYIKKYSGNDTLKRTYTLTFAELKEKLNAFVADETDGAVTVASFETEGDTPLYAKSFDKAGGYVVNTNAYYEENGKRVYLRGIDIRKAIGSSTLRSHSFTLEYDEKTDKLTFTTWGHGHGLGLSQYGAIGYANEAGWSWRQILNHYYSLSDTGRYRIVEPVWE